VLDSFELYREVDTPSFAVLTLNGLRKNFVQTINNETIYIQLSRLLDCIGWHGANAKHDP
jgi:hypothetical protein